MELRFLALRRGLLYILAVYFTLLALYVFFLPETFYNLTPGLSMMGPYNLHFIRDVSFAFFVSGATLFYGTKHSKRDVLIIGAAWPFLHALFHCYIWAHRGFPFDFIWFSDAMGVIVPGFMVFILALRFAPKPS